MDAAFAAPYGCNARLLYESTGRATVVLTAGADPAPPPSIDSACAEVGKPTVAITRQPVSVRLI
jgi:hypothetical protein